MALDSALDALPIEVPEIAVKSSFHHHIIVCLWSNCQCMRLVCVSHRVHLLCAGRNQRNHVCLLPGPRRRL